MRIKKNSSNSSLLFYIHLHAQNPHILPSIIVVNKELCIQSERNIEENNIHNQESTRLPSMVLLGLSNK